MTKQLIAVKDKKANLFLAPGAWVSVGAALRDLSDLAKDSGPFAKHPGDYEVYQLGE